MAEIFLVEDDDNHVLVVVAEGADNALKLAIDTEVGLYNATAKLLGHTTIASPGVIINAVTGEDAEEDASV